jgi:hypothetical protein
MFDPSKFPCSIRAQERAVKCIIAALPALAGSEAGLRAKSSPFTGLCKTGARSPIY